MRRGKDAYAASGVDLDVNVATKEGIRAAVDSTRTDLVQAGFQLIGA